MFMLDDKQMFNNTLRYDNVDDYEFFLIVKCFGQIYLWVDPLRTSPQIYETHSTSKQHRTQIKKTFQSKLFIKRLSCHVEVKTLSKFTKTCVLMWKMNV
jgi:hypothetical protein